MTKQAEIAPPTLPNDIEGLRALLLATMAERDELATQNDRLRHLLLKLKRMQFGTKSERLPEEQMLLALEDLEQAIAKGDAEAEKRDPELGKDRAAKRRANRGELPPHLPRIEITLQPEDTACPCCQATMTVIGEDTSQRLDVIPALELARNPPRSSRRLIAEPLRGAPEGYGPTACLRAMWRSRIGYLWAAR